jgi:hypothetical protein
VLGDGFSSRLPAVLLARPSTPTGKLNVLLAGSG